MLVFAGAPVNETCVRLTWELISSKEDMSVGIVGGADAGTRLLFTDLLEVALLKGKEEATAAAGQHTALMRVFPLGVSDAGTF